MRKIKNWIIHKLGGLVFDDIPMRIQQDLLSYWANRAMDKEMKETLENGFYGKSYID